MTIKPRHIAALCCALFLFPIVVHAEPPRSFPYFVEWESIEGAGGYRVEARDRDGKTLFAEQKTPKETSCDIDLAPGKYAFRVVTLNKFLRAENTTSWIPFVIEAYTAPIISKVLPAVTLTDSAVSLTLTADRMSNAVSAWLISPSGAKTTLKITKRKNGTFSLSGSPLSERGSYSLFLSNPPNLVSQKKGAFSAQYPIPVVDSVDPQTFATGDQTIRVTGKNFSPEASIALVRTDDQAFSVGTVAAERSKIELLVTAESSLASGEYDVFISNASDLPKIRAGKIIILDPKTKNQLASKLDQTQPTAPEQPDPVDHVDPVDQTPSKKTRTPFSLPTIKKISFSGGPNLNIGFGDWQDLYPWPTITGHGSIDFHFTDNLNPTHGGALDYSIGIRGDVLHAQRERDTLYVDSALTSASVLLCPAATLSFRYFRAKAHVGIGASRTALVTGNPTGTSTEEMVSFDPAYAGGLTIEYPITDWLACGIANQFLIIQTGPAILIYSASVCVSIYIP